jgi:dihydroxyacetone kinase
MNRALEKKFWASMGVAAARESRSRGHRAIAGRVAARLQGDRELGHGSHGCRGHQDQPSKLEEPSA